MNYRGVFNGSKSFLQHHACSGNWPKKTRLRLRTYFTDLIMFHIILFSYVQLPADQVDTQLLQDATRKEIAQNKAK